MQLSNFPRTFFAHIPTPLEPLKKLSSFLNGPNIWIKRDDCTGVAGGGNKTRKLEFLIADALQDKANVIITQGATQSNHVRQTVAIAGKYGFESHVLLEDRTKRSDENHNHNGNVLLTQLCGATIERHPQGTNMDAKMEEVANRISMQDKGKIPYIIPGGGSNAIGALGYVNCALELVSQINSINLKVDQVIHATGSTGTQAGLVAGFEAMNSHIPVLGIGVRLPKAEQEAKVLKTTQDTAEKLDFDCAHIADKITANCDYVGDGYGIPNQGTLEAIRLLAQLEGIFLDPVYSGKGMAGLINLIRQSYYNKGDNIIFIHTGGAQALPGYLNDF